MSAKFKMSNRAIGQLLRSPEVAAEMRRRAERIKAAAEAIAPVGGPGDPHPGRYKSGFKTLSTPRGGVRRDRATATVYNDVPYARWVEYGTEHVPAHHVLLRAALAAGGES